MMIYIFILQPSCQLAACLENDKVLIKVLVLLLERVIIHSLQYSTVYSTVQYSTVQYSTVQYSTVQYSTGEMLVLLLARVIIHSLLQSAAAQLQVTRP